MVTFMGGLGCSVELICSHVTTASVQPVPFPTRPPVRLLVGSHPNTPASSGFFEGGEIMELLCYELLYCSLDS